MKGMWLPNTYTVDLPDDDKRWQSVEFHML